SSRSDPSRERLLKAAQKVFAHRGYAGASVQDIVSAAGVTKPTLYYYFGSKAGIYRSMVEAAFDERLDLMQKAASESDTLRGKLTEVLSALFQYARDHRELSRLCFSSACAAAGEIPTGIPAKRSRRNFEFLHKLIAAGIRRGELSSRYDSIELTTIFFSHVLFYAIAQIVDFPGAAHRLQPARLVDLFFDGAGGRR
ncbi:MAG: TetR/AcrR family transcriptional regulator, partial [Verrucomicrobiae bacterium]|nr:TetR/AcrR family transcriptional regulator [Verrucomicrobiae bacterium]